MSLESVLVKRIVEDHNGHIYKEQNYRFQWQENSRFCKNIFNDWLKYECLNYDIIILATRNLLENLCTNAVSLITPEGM